MNLAEFCWKLYLWPLLIAKFKGICYNYKTTAFPYITLPPGATFAPTASATGTTLPFVFSTVNFTFPTVLTAATSLPTFPTLPSAPTAPTAPGTLPTFPTLPPTAATLPTFPTLPPTVATLPTFPTLPPTVPTLPTFPTLPPTAATLPTFPTLPPTVATLPTFPTLPPTVATLPTIPTLPPTVATLPTFPTLPPTNIPPTIPTFPTLATVTQIPPGTLPTFPTINPGSLTTLNCPDGVVLCPVPGATQQPNGCPCIDPRGSAIGLLLQAYQLAQNCYSPDNLPGICINIQNCAFLYQLVQTGEVGALGSLGAYIKKSLCGYDGVDLLVCCPTQFSPITQTIPQYTQQFTFNTLTPGSTAPGVTVTTYQTNAPPTATTSVACGVSNFTQTRVVGGGPAKLGQYPWIAALGYISSATSAISFNCAGSLITQKHILTTAHCVNNNLYLARLGEYDLNSTNDGAFPIDIVIEQKIVHEQYDSKLIYNDIALLKLRDFAPISDQIRPICLPLNEPLRSRDLTGYQPFIAGWGAVTYQGPASSILQEAQIPVISTSDCERNYRAYFPNQVFDSRVLCAGYGGKDSCQGDSGGPLMLPQVVAAGSPNYYFVLIGLVSYGYECATDGFPGVYTRVPYYIPWIESKLNV